MKHIPMSAAMLLALGAALTAIPVAADTRVLDNYGKHCITRVSDVRSRPDGNTTRYSLDVQNGCGFAVTITNFALMKDGSLSGNTTVYAYGQATLSCNEWPRGDSWEMRGCTGINIAWDERS